jgi:hypothetical protein
MAKQSSIKLSSDFVEEARRETGVSHRSVGGQVEYWAKLGRAIENIQGFDVERVREALNGRLRIESLPAAEGREPFLMRLSASFDNPDDATRERYVALGERKGAVGSDGKGGVVRAAKRQADGG